jgi:feruloyl-CoA synthase
LSFIDPQQPEAGLRFEGRASDDFKLASGTRVHASALRLIALEALAPLVADVVIVGEGRNDVRMLMFVDWARCAAQLGLDAAASPEQWARSNALAAALHERLTLLAGSVNASSRRVVAGLLVLIPPSASNGELTEKGTINGRFLQRNRPELLELLFGDAETALRIGPISE